ncbi:hypothetical protein ACWIFB_09685 [Dietzia sp. NPDC055340]
MSSPAPHPRPGPSGPDIDALRVAFDDLLVESAGLAGQSGGEEIGAVRDDQVAALDAAHELLSDALSALDSQR